MSKFNVTKINKNIQLSEPCRFTFQFKIIFLRWKLSVSLTDLLRCSVEWIFLGSSKVLSSGDIPVWVLSLVALASFFKKKSYHTTAEDSERFDTLIHQKNAKKSRVKVVPGLEPGIREIYDFDVSKSHVLTATLYNQLLTFVYSNL